MLVSSLELVLNKYLWIELNMITYYFHLADFLHVLGDGEY